MSSCKEAMQDYARAAIEPYAKRIAELESQLEAIGAGGVTQGPRLIEADRKTYNSIGEGTIQQLHDVLLYLQNETMKLGAAYGSNFKKEATEKARAATEKMKEAVYAIKNIDRQRRGEPVAYQVRCGVGEDWYEVDQQAYQLVRSTRPCDARALYLAQQPAEPVKKKDWNVELSSWSDEDFVQVFHERPDLADRFRRVLAEPVKCPDPSMGEHVCNNRAQCWEPCGELGKSVDHAKHDMGRNPWLCRAGAGLRRGSWGSCSACMVRMGWWWW